MLCRKDNDKVPGGKFRFFFLNFPENANENLENMDTFKSVPHALQCKSHQKLKPLAGGLDLFFLSTAIGEKVQCLFIQCIL